MSVLLCRAAVAPAAADLLRSLFDAVVAAAQPDRLVAQNLPDPPKGRTIVIGAGKAAGAMARAFEARWQAPLSGVVAVPHAVARPGGVIRQHGASHPVPDAASFEAARLIRMAIAEAGPDDLVVALISGGGSSLMCEPAPGLTLADKQAVNDALLASGASISEMNCVRKHLSVCKGGRLVPTGGVPLLALLMSDVPGDDPSVIASGPTVPDPTKLADARAVLARARIPVPERVRLALLDPANETPKPDDPRFVRVENRMVLTPDHALREAIPLLTSAGYEVLYLGDALEGDAETLAQDHAQRALDLRRQGRRVAILSGGETNVRASGVVGAKGGRNSHYALALALALGEAAGVTAISADTDGVDGRGGHAGAFVFPETLARMRRAGLDPAQLLVQTNSHAAFAGIGDLLVTGPTETNVNDLRVLLIDPI
ncbi:glycerate kinase [Rhabdaerophilum sp.]|uniref:glycerate kinase type-2 family protein n=1 Tax=Rhabdaerophilum sp. TaxID=2717341 RepID=UPI0038D42896